MAMAMAVAMAHASSARFKEIVQDITDGYEWVWAHLAQHVGAKSVRGVAVTGWSAGAHLACLVVSCDGATLVLRFHSG
jgi:acetyl esterase/lipase